MWHWDIVTDISQMGLFERFTLAYLPPFSKFAVLGRSACLVVSAFG
jgi:hypothetical protein